MNSKHGNIDKEMGTVLKDFYNKCFETQKERKDITSTLLKYSKKEIPSMSFEECQNLIRKKTGEISDISLANYKSVHEYKEMRKAVYQEMKALSDTNKELSLENSALELMDEIHKKTVQATEMTHNKCINIKEETESLPKSNKFDKQRTIQFLTLRESVVNYKAVSNDLQASNRIFCKGLENVKSALKEAKGRASFEVKRTGNSVERTFLGGIIKAIEIVKNNIDAQIAQTETMQKQASKVLNGAIDKLNQNEHGQKMAKFLDKEFGSGNTIDSMEQFKTISKFVGAGISALKNKQLERSEKFINNNKDRISEQQILKMSEKFNQNQDIVRENFENMKNNGYDFNFPEKEDMSEWKDAVGEGMKVDWGKPSSNSIEPKTNDDIDIAE